MKLYNSTIAIAVVSILPAFAQSSSNSVEQTFGEQLAQSNVAGIELGKLAQQKGSNEKTREFGSRMVQDHTELNNQLKEWAQTNHVSLPTGISTSAADQKRKLEQLEQLSGEAFDNAYIMDMLSDHQHAVSEVQKVVENTSDAKVKELAEKCLPILENHFRLAENLAGEKSIDAKKGLNSPEHPQ